MKKEWKVRVRVRSATTSNWVCAHVCVRTLIWTCEVRACDPKNGRNSHLENMWPFFYFTKIKVATLSINEIIPFSLAFAMPQVEESQKKSSKDHNNEEKVGPNRRFFFTSPLDSLFGKVHKEW